MARMNPLDLLRTLDDIRKDKPLTEDIIRLLDIVNAAADKTASDCKDDPELQKGFESLKEALSVASGYMKKGKIPLSVKFSLALKYKEMGKNLEYLGEVLLQEDHTLTEKFTAHITGAESFDGILVHIWEKANDKMIRLVPCAQGCDVFELISGQEMRLCRLDAAQFARLTALIDKSRADKPPKRKFG